MATDNVHEPTYPWIRRWAQLLRISEHDTKKRIAQAKREEAPEGAIFKNDSPFLPAHLVDGCWWTVDDITNPATRRALGLPAEIAGNGNRRSSDAAEQGVSRSAIRDRLRRRANGEDLDDGEL